MSATVTVLGGIGALILAWAIGLTLRAVTVRLWRTGCCARGHHRVALSIVDEWREDHSVGLPGCYRRHRVTAWRCLDCPHVETLSEDAIHTPSRRYALQPKPKRVA